jgi:hypothetical protein
MALNFGIFDQGGPSGFYEGFTQAGEKMQANAMAQQKAAQAQQEFGMRQQEFAAGQADKQRVAKAAAVTQKLASFKDALLRSRNPVDARRIVEMQYADPDIGPIRGRFSPLEQALAEVPDEPSAFQKYLADEAMGMEEARKQQYRQSQVAGLLGDGGAVSAPGSTNAMIPAGAMPQAAPVANAMAPAAPNVADLISRRNRAIALGEKDVVTALSSDIARLSPAAAAPTTLAKLQTEMAALPPNDPRRAEYRALIAKETSHPLPTRVETKINAFVPASEAAQTEFMKEARVTYSALKGAQPTLDNIEAAKALVPTAKGFMGTGGEPLLAAASFLNNRLGTKIDTKGVTDATELRSRLFFGILDNLKKLDSQPSQAQQAALQQALGSLGTDPSALGRVLDAFGDSIRTKVDLHNAEISDAESKGIKFPYNPKITLKPKSGTSVSNPHAGKTDAQIKKELGL